jgi:hypothetical protein
MSNPDEFNKEVQTIYRMFSTACEESSVAITAPSHVKTFMLQYISALQEASMADPALTLPRSDLKAKYNESTLDQALTWYETRDQAADGMAKVLKLWKERCIAVIDEVDWVLHPLKSELNFPIGKDEKLTPNPQRFTLPVFLLDAVVAISKGGETPYPEGFQAKEAYGEVKSRLEAGIKTYDVQKFPHLVIMSKDWYRTELKQVMGEVALIYLEMQFRVALGYEAEVPEQALLPFKETDEAWQRLWKEEMVEPILCFIGTPRDRGAGVGVGVDGIDALKDLKKNGKLGKDDTLSFTMIQVLQLCRDWLGKLLVHVIGKRDRIEYGLLVEEDKPHDKVGEEVSQAARQIMAVPFMGKDKPSAAAEFASPDVVIGFTTLAYLYEGLRKFNFYILAHRMHEDMGREIGPYQDRRSRIVFQRWIESAKALRDVGKPPVDVMSL